MRAMDGELSLKDTALLLGGSIVLAYVLARVLSHLVCS